MQYLNIFEYSIIIKSLTEFWPLNNKNKDFVFYLGNVFHKCFLKLWHTGPTHLGPIWYILFNKRKIDQQPAHKAGTAAHWFIFHTDTGLAQSHLLTGSTPPPLFLVSDAVAQSPTDCGGPVWAKMLMLTGWVQVSVWSLGSNPCVTLLSKPWAFHSVVRGEKTQAVCTCLLTGLRV